MVCTSWAAVLGSRTRVDADNRSLTNPLTGEPDAGDPPVRFGGRGSGQPLSLPLSLRSFLIVKPSKSARFAGFDFVAGLAHHPGCHSGGVFDELDAFLRAEDADDLGQAVSGDAIRGDDADQTVIGEADAGVRVNDVGIALPADFEPLKEIARGGKGGAR